MFILDRNFIYRKLDLGISIGGSIEFIKRHNLAFE